MTSSVIISLGITIQPTPQNRSTLDTVNGTAARLSIAERRPASGLPEKILDFLKIDPKNISHFFQYSVS